MSKPTNRLIAKGYKALVRPGKRIRLFVTIHITSLGCARNPNTPPGSVNTSTFSPVAFAGEIALTLSRGKQMAGIVPPVRWRIDISR